MSRQLAIRKPLKTMDGRAEHSRGLDKGEPGAGRWGLEGAGHQSGGGGHP